MILASLLDAERYAGLHPGFPRAFKWLQTASAELPAGRIEFDGDRLFVLVGRDPGRGEAGAKLESHRRYIDIQCTLAGVERIGWRDRRDCTSEADFDPDRDIGFYTTRPATWLEIPTGSFAIFYPEDAHAPLASNSSPVKAVVKVALNWEA